MIGTPLILSLHAENLSRSMPDCHIDPLDSHTPGFKIGGRAAPAVPACVFIVPDSVIGELNLCQEICHSDIYAIN